MLFISSIGLIATGGRTSVIVCMVATLPLWVFYGPATFASIHHVSSGSGPFEVLPFLPPFLLIAFTGLAAVAILVHNQRLQLTGDTSDEQ